MQPEAFLEETEELRGMVLEVLEVEALWVTEVLRVRARVELRREPVVTVAAAAAGVVMESREDLKPVVSGDLAAAAAALVGIMVLMGEMGPEVMEVLVAAAAVLRQTEVEPEVLGEDTEGLVAEVLSAAAAAPGWVEVYSFTKEKTGPIREQISAGIMLSAVQLAVVRAGEALRGRVLALIFS